MTNGVASGVEDGGWALVSFENENNAAVTAATAYNIGHTALARAATSLASHPEFGQKVLEGFSTDDGLVQLRAWRAVGEHFRLFTEENGGTGPIEHEEAIRRILTSLTRGADINNIAPRLYNRGFLESVTKTEPVWEALAGYMNGFVSPAYRQNPAFRRKEHAWKIEEVFRHAPIDILGDALLCIADAPASERFALSDYLRPGYGVRSDRPAYAAWTDAPIKRAMRRVSTLIDAPYYALRQKATSQQAARNIAIRRTGLIKLTGLTAVNGQNSPTTYTKLLEQHTQIGKGDLEPHIQLGLYDMLKYYVHTFNIDADKLMAAIKLQSPKIAGRSPIPTVKIRLTDEQVERAIKLMRPALPAGVESVSIEAFGGRTGEPLTDVVAARILLPLMMDRVPKGLPLELRRGAYNQLAPHLDERLAKVLGARAGLTSQMIPSFLDLCTPTGLSYRQVMRTKEKLHDYLTALLANESLPSE